MPLKPCKHSHLLLLPKTSKRLQCRYCHLTIKEEELNHNYCPECYESSGKKRAEFKIIESEENTRYRCEKCHAIIEYVARK